MKPKVKTVIKKFTDDEELYINGELCKTSNSYIEASEIFDLLAQKGISGVGLDAMSLLRLLAEKGIIDYKYEEE